MKLYALVLAKVATMRELKTCVTLDEALKLFALWRMSQDIEAAKMDETKDSIGRPGRRR